MKATEKVRSEDTNDPDSLWIAVYLTRLEYKGASFDLIRLKVETAIRRLQERAKELWGSASTP
jgi:hypothetical protein